MRQSFRVLILLLLLIEPTLAQDQAREINLKLKKIDSLLSVQNFDKAKSSIYQLKQVISGSNYAGEDSI